LPNGVTRDFRARVSQLDGRANEELDRTEGAIRSEGNKAGDTRTVAETAAAGASVARWPELSQAMLEWARYRRSRGGRGRVGRCADDTRAGGCPRQGHHDRDVLDRSVAFNENELDFSGAFPHRASDGGGPLPSQKSRPNGFPRRIPD